MVDGVNKNIVIDDVEYSINDLSENAKAQILNIKFVDDQIQELNNQWAVADTARIGYTNALKLELMKASDEA